MAEFEQHDRIPESDPLTPKPTAVDISVARLNPHGEVPSRARSALSRTLRSKPMGWAAVGVGALGLCTVSRNDVSRAFGPERDPDLAMMAQPENAQLPRGIRDIKFNLGAGSHDKIEAEAAQLGRFLNEKGEIVSAKELSGLSEFLKGDDGHTVVIDGESFKLVYAQNGSEGYLAIDNENIHPEVIGSAADEEASPDELREQTLESGVENLNPLSPKKEQAPGPRKSFLEESRQIPVSIMPLEQ